MMKKLEASFFSRHTTEVAQDLLGQVLVFGDYQGIITETEAYRGLDDEASHAFRGKTPRASIMYGPPGVSYVYFIYGMYYCLNIVTEADGEPGAVLIRGLKLLAPHETHLTGPGKLCRALNITTRHNGIDIVTSNDFYIATGSSPLSFKSTPRIGIKKATDKLWRFILIEG
jgi:DNA-3-methyladenine glycosylase